VSVAAGPATDAIVAAAVGRRRRMAVDVAVNLALAVLWPSLLLAATVAVWLLAIRITHWSSLLLPTPSQVVHAGWLNRDLLLNGLGTTMWESAVGFGIAVGAGLVFAVLIVSSQAMARALLPGLTLLNASPKVVIAPVLAIWLGFGPASKIWLAALLSFFPIVINCIRGLSNVDPALLEFWHLMRAKRRRILWQIQLPNCLPYLYDGALIALPIAIVGAVIGEFVAAEKGIGHIIIVAYSNLDIATVFAATILVSVTSTLLFLLVRASEPLVIRWNVRGETIAASEV
jgi:NitT/TauT family transport system permease protein